MYRRFSVVLFLGVYVFTFFGSLVSFSNAGLIYSTYLGGSGDEGGSSIAVDISGNAYITGGTNSIDFPTTAGVFDTTFSFNTSKWGTVYFDVFITKLNADGSAIVYSTFLGGSGGESGNDIAVDNSGNVYITGSTSSPDFPTTAGAFDTILSGGYDTFITKINDAGSALVYSTFFGGSNLDYGHAIALDNAGNAYIIGWTNSSTDFTTTAGAYDRTFNGNGGDISWGGDAFVTKLNATGSAPVYSTYLGGSNQDGDDYAGIAVDNLGNAYVTGSSGSPDFPTTTGAYDRTNNGSQDIFVTKLNPAGSALVYSTLIGGSGYENGIGIAIDNSGNAYITGYTFSSTDFPTTPGAFDTLYNGAGLYPDYDVFMTKLNASGTALVYSTYLGGGGSDRGHDIAIDSSGNAYITGETESTDFPTTPGAFDTLYNGSGYDGGDVFVSKLNASGTALLYSTYLGGGNEDYGRGIAVDGSGNAYIIGFTNSSTDFPNTAGGFDFTYNGGGDAFVTKLSLVVTPTSPVASFYGTPVSGIDPLPVQFHDTSSGIPTSWHWTFGDGATSTQQNPLHTYQNAGTYTVSLMASNAYGTSTATKNNYILVSPRFLNSYGTFTVSKDTTHWLFEKYGDGISAGTLSWISAYHCINLYQTPGQKGKITQVFSVPSTGWYTAIARVLTDISNVSKQQKVYLYLQELNSSNAIVATGNQVVQSGAGGLNVGGWKQLQVSFYAQKTVLGVQVVGINPTTSNATGSLYLDDIWVYAAAPQVTTPITLNNPSFDAGTVGWMYDVYADGTGPGIWSEWSGLLVGEQAGGEKGKVSQLYSAPTSNTLGSVMVFSAATSMSNTQKVYLYVYSYNNAYSTIIESGNAILQPGKWTPGQWRQLQFGYTPFTQYNAVQLVGINPASNPYQAIYFDDLEVKQE